MYSVIIPTHNRSESLLKTLYSVTDQTLPSDKYEILIIDDGSMDDTGQVVARYEQQVSKPKIRYFKIEHSGSAAAKNFGIKQARGDIIFFTDDDCIVPENWMETLVGGYKKYPDVVGAGGWYVPPKDEKRFFQKTAHLINTLFYSSYGNREKIINTLPVSVASIPNVSYKKSVLERADGFDEKISSLGSVELKYRLVAGSGKKILYVPSTVIHCCPLDFFAYMRRFFNQGRCKQYCNVKYFGGKPPLIFDVSFLQAPKKLLSIFSNVLNIKGTKETDLTAIFIYFVLEVFINSCGGLYERILNKNVYK